MSTTPLAHSPQPGAIPVPSLRPLVQTLVPLPAVLKPGGIAQTWPASGKYDQHWTEKVKQSLTPTQGMLPVPTNKPCANHMLPDMRLPQMPVLLYLPELDELDPGLGRARVDSGWCCSEVRR